MNTTEHTYTYMHMHMHIHCTCTFIVFICNISLHTHWGSLYIKTFAVVGYQLPATPIVI